jgi:predicted DNA-binding transcriptional regulator AlpA
MRFLRVKQFAELSGYSEKAIYAKMNTGVWTEKWQYRRAPDNVIVVDVEAFNRWVLGEKY